jgi:hypothetical protein
VLFSIVLLPVVTTHVLAGIDHAAQYRTKTTGTRSRVPMDSNERHGALADVL